MAVSGPAVASIGFGTILLYSAFKGKSVLATTQAIVSGKNPKGVKSSQQIQIAIGTGVTTGAGIGPASGGSNAAILQNTAAEFGWTGNQWTALAAIESEEDAGYDTTIKNPSSGALGMAQALGHGTANTAGTLGNEYGGYGLTDAQARMANSGDASMQALWMCNYIRDVYGNPVTAQQFHLAHGWY